MRTSLRVVLLLAAFASLSACSGADAPAEEGPGADASEGGVDSSILVEEGGAEDTGLAPEAATDSVVDSTVDAIADAGSDAVAETADATLDTADTTDTKVEDGRGGAEDTGVEVSLETSVDTGAADTSIDVTPSVAKWDEATWNGAVWQ